MYLVEVIFLFLDNIWLLNSRINIIKFVPAFIGAFEDPDIIHVDDTVDPVRDLEIIGEELRLKVLSIYIFNNIVSAGWFIDWYLLLLLACVRCV